MMLRRALTLAVAGLAVAAAAVLAATVAGAPSPALILLSGPSALYLVSFAVVLALRWRRPPTSAFMLRTRSALRRQDAPRHVSHVWVDRDAIAKPMRVMAVAAEDVHFLHHHGFDWQSIADAYRHNRAHERMRGGSTISQQTAKNLFLWLARSYTRKAAEAYFTLLIEALWPKRRILEVYLNIAQFAPAVFGVGAAARALLGKSAAELTVHDAALLAAALPNPAALDVAKPGHMMRLRQFMILSSARRLPDAYVDQL